MADEITQPKNKSEKKDYIFAIGRRKSAVARVRLYDTVRDGLEFDKKPVKKGDFVVNGRPVSEYFASDIMRYRYSEPFRVVNAQNKYTVTVRVVGGGPAGQLDAVIAGISNALSKADVENFRPSLKKKGFLTRDSRVRQRRMVGMGGKSRRKKQSPKR